MSKTVDYIVVDQDGMAQMFTQDEIQKALDECSIAERACVYSILNHGVVSYKSFIKYEDDKLNKLLTDGDKRELSDTVSELLKESDTLIKRV